MHEPVATTPETSQEPIMADHSLATDGAADTAIAAVVVTIRRDPSGAMSVHVEPVADHVPAELAPTSLAAYVAPGPRETHPWPLRRRRSALAGRPSASPIIGSSDDDTGQVPRRGRFPTRPGALRPLAIAVGLALLAALVTVALITRPVTRSSTALDPTTLTSPPSPSIPASVAAATSCSQIATPAWIGGLYGIYGNSTDTK
jgi:hypothetical protein